MTNTKTKLRSIRKRASKHTDVKTSTITIDSNDFWWIMRQIHYSQNLELLNAQNDRLHKEVVELRGLSEGVSI